MCRSRNHPHRIKAHTPYLFIGGGSLYSPNPANGNSHHNTLSNETDHTINDFGPMASGRFFPYRVVLLLWIAASLFMLTPLLSSAWAYQVTLAWDANTEPDIAGYMIHYGTASRDYTHSVDVKKRPNIPCRVFPRDKPII